MDSPFSRAAPARPNQHFVDAFKEKLRGADIVAVGVNLVVGALLVGSVVGALVVKEPGGSPPNDLNAAALAAHADARGNETAPSPASGGDAASYGHEDPEDAASDK